MPVLDNPVLIGAAPTVPDNVAQPLYFAEPTKAAKDVFVLELRHYFASTALRRQTTTGITEVPQIDKYSVAGNKTTDPLETALDIIRAYPDLTEDLPAIAVLSATGQNLKMDVSTRFVAQVQYAPRLVCNHGPYNLQDGDFIRLRTFPDGVTAQDSNLIVKSLMFADITQVTPQQLAQAINFQALYVYASTATSSGNTIMVLETGKLGFSAPNTIIVTGGSSNMLTQLGLTLNQQDSSSQAGKQVMNRYMSTASLTLGIEVIAEDDNARTDITDLLYTFFTFALADRGFTLYGRSIFDPTIPDEWYQIIIKDAEVAIAGEQEFPRPSDSRDKIYVNRINVPCQVIQYIDRIIVGPNGQPITPYVAPTVSVESLLPQPS